jgi:hypothetical protein
MLDGVEFVIMLLRHYQFVWVLVGEMTTSLFRTVEISKLTHPKFANTFLIMFFWVTEKVKHLNRHYALIMF